MLSCAQCADLLPDILEGRGDPLLKRRLEEQMQSCERCRRCVEGYSKTAALTRHAYEEASPPKACDHLLAILRDHWTHSPGR